MTLHVPVGDGQELLAGPLARPTPPPGRSALAAVLLVTVVLGTAWLVAAPIARRLQKLEAASRDLRAGALSTRVEVRGRDLIAQLGVTFNEMAEALECRVRDREELLQAVAHEYSTPLTRMEFTFELLCAEGERGLRFGERVETLRGDLSELRALTGELLEWLHAEAPVQHPFDVDATLRAVLVAEGAAWALLSGQERLVWSGDERAFRRATANLVRNAVTFARGRIVVSRSVQAGVLEVVVEDDGPGVPEAERDRLFEPTTARAWRGRRTSLNARSPRRRTVRAGPDWASPSRTRSPCGLGSTSSTRRTVACGSNVPARRDSSARRRRSVASQG